MKTKVPWFITVACLSIWTWGLFTANAMDGYVNGFLIAGAVMTFISVFVGQPAIGAPSLSARMSGGPFNLMEPEEEDAGQATATARQRQLARVLLLHPLSRESLAANITEPDMNWTQLKGDLKQVGGKFKVQWAKLTDDDLLLLEGKKDVFLGKLQERTGLAKDEAEKQLDAFVANLNAET